jgi:outer membrane immunogenic protein
MNRLSMALSLGASLLAVPAAAQDQASDNGGFVVGVVTGFDSIGITADDETDRETGSVTGLTGGYDFVLGKTIVGIEAEVTDTSIGDGIGEDGYLGLRVGYEMDDNDVVYLKAGYTCVNVDADDDLEGARIGAGFEHNFGSFFGRLEYRYTSYDIKDTINDGLSADRHQVMVAAGIKF